MIVGLGVDIVEIDRMRLALERHPRMKERCFSEVERAYCDGRARPEVHYALRFAAKEAVLKAIGTGFAGMRFTDIEVEKDDHGRPVPVLHGRAAETARSLGVAEMHLSLSFTHATAVASAVALSAAEPPPPTELGPKEKLAAAFKEARGMLDCIGASPAEDDAEEREEA